MPHPIRDQRRLVAYIPENLHHWVKEKAVAENRTISNFVQTVLADMQQRES